MKKNSTTRRSFLLNSGKAALALGLSQTILPGFITITKQKNKTFTQTPLSYSYADLQPAIDDLTMEIHYSKHAAGYCKNLNEAFAVEVKDDGLELENILMNISAYSTKMKNNAGGHFNHEMFWKCLSPQKKSLSHKALQEKINHDFGSFEKFTLAFNDAAKTRFGSGWAWLIQQKDGKLVVVSTANQDNPLMDVVEIKGKPLLCLDIWEHAYYLKYQNKRVDYINNFWSIVNWDFVAQQFSA
ncbi:MAG: superoxide dismutase [Chitinophagaceae bacterium]|nr:superoxide dismutase [Chitinophagaceae bacterium]